MDFEPRDQDYDTKVRQSFDRQQMMHTLGAKMVSVLPGEVVLEMPFNPDFTQQHGFLHAGAITTMLDSAAGYAAFSLMLPQASVLTVELKTSLLAPAKGENFRFIGRVIKPGRTITFCEAEALALTDDRENRKIASMTATMMCILDREGVQG